MSINIDLSKVNETIVDKYIAHYEIKVRGGINAKVNALENHTNTKVPESEHSTPCSKCGGISDFNLPECPYCGDQDVNDDAPSVSNVAAGNGAAAEESAPTVTTSGEGVEVVEKPKEKQKLTRVKKTKSNGAVPHAPLAATNASELVSSVELDNAIARVGQAIRAGGESYWDLGHELLVIHEKQLWKQRTEGGRQAYPSFNVFCRDELHMSHAHAYASMDVARGFSREDFLEIGVKKVQLLLRLPRERQQQLTEEARNGQISKARLREIVETEAPGTDGVRNTGRSTRATKATQAAAAARAEKRARKLAPPAGAVTAVAQLGREKIKLYARSKKDSKAKPTRAMSVTQDPWGEEMLVNGVTVRYTIVKEKTGLVLVVERTRGEAKVEE